MLRDYKIQCYCPFRAGTFSFKNLAVNIPKIGGFAGAFVKVRVSIDFFFYIPYYFFHFSTCCIKLFWNFINVGITSGSLQTECDCLFTIVSVIVRIIYSSWRLLIVSDFQVIPTPPQPNIHVLNKLAKQKQSTTSKNLTNTKILYTTI